MCGLTGYWSPKTLLEPSSIIESMTQTLFHRGPDAGSTWFDVSAGIAFGHRRLAVLELSENGAQPMHSACRQYVLIFNGEIYNHLSLRAELSKQGIVLQWRGHSDTETLLACFSAWGVKHTLQRCVGMFAFALWDKKERSITIARDRFGEKPLYYGWVGSGCEQTFVFSSELKALRAHPCFNNPVNRGALSLYLMHCVVPAPHSIYENIFKLLPGAILTLSYDDFAERAVHTEPYWKLTDVVHQGMVDPVRCEKDALSLLDSTLRESVALQAEADVPLGAFLSGGVDSSTIVAMMQVQSDRPVQTFTVGFDEAGFDESPHALAVAKHLGTDHHEIRVTSKDARDVIPLLPRLYDEPFSDSSQIPTYLVCKAARQNVTVVLSGDAGDELFGGYNRYFWAGSIWNKIAWVPPAMRQVFGQMIQQLPIETWDQIGNKMPGMHGIARLGDKAHKLAYRMKTVKSLDDLYKSLVTEWPANFDLVKGNKPLASQLDNQDLVSGLSDAEHRMMLWDSLTYLPDDILTKVDRAAMGVSLETRVPFLDHRVAELAWRLPLNMKIRDGVGKWALRQVLYNYVPRELIERPKAGFSIPVGQWLRGPLRDWAEALLDAKRLEKEGYLNPAPIREIWLQHLSGRYDWTVRLWSVLMFQAWLEENR
ncbi:asparagine synthase (glutamine-hydrolyzing) [Candidatus Roizmanbacteria bacterium]|nr:asparagine synthase (glutamine-hydrolyzing) [Candidatus Roizmanbacteria bacterium]